jgi:hypothetical protein
MRRTLFLALVLCAGCAPQPLRSDWGPMAVVGGSGEGTLGANGGTGTLEITPRCVVLHREDTRSVETLVWVSGQVTWDDLLAKINFTSFEAETLHLGSGDRIEVGGARPGDGVKWLRQPDPSCPVQWFIADTVIPK